MTPKVLRDSLLKQIPIHPGYRILDPGVGTGEFLKSCYDKQPNSYLEGWDIDQHAINVAKKLVPGGVFIKQSALNVEFEPVFDLIIGNPPYFEISNLDKDLKLKFKEVIGGRTNIFSLFFKVGLESLKPGGLLGFVVPPSMNNGAFFSNLRNYINSQANIEYLKVINENNLFEDAQTSVQLIILKKGAKPKKHFVDMGKISHAPIKRIIYSENPRKLSNQFRDKTSLWNLGYEACTGAIVWNKNKHLLKSSSSDRTVTLIWSHNIKNDNKLELEIENKSKPQYVESLTYLTGPAIVVNRITGGVGRGSLRCALVPEGMKFLAENHVNVIRARVNSTQGVSWKELLGLLNEPSVKDSVQAITGNTQISSTELTYFLPLNSNRKGIPKYEQDHLFEK